MPPRVNELLAAASTWGNDPFKRHNDASYAIYKISTLTDFGLRTDDPGIDGVLEKVFAHLAPEGAFQTVVNIPKSFGGDGEDHWTWMLCDSPTLLYSLLAFGLGNDPRVQKAIEHLTGLVDENGWRFRPNIVTVQPPTPEQKCCSRTGPGRDCEDVLVWRRQRLSQTEIPLRLVQHSARGGGTQPFSIRPR